MRVRPTDPAALYELSEFLRSRINAVVRRRGDDELEVTLLGSYSNLAMAEKIGEAMRDWEAGERLSVYELALDA